MHFNSWGCILFPKIEFDYIYQFAQLIVSDTKILTDSHVRPQHRLYTTHASKDRNRAKFPFPIAEQITLENVSKEMFFQ